jgi:hypothetical protein
MDFEFWKGRRRTVEEMLISLSECGISLRPHVPVESLFAEFSRETIEKDGFEALLCEMGNDRFGPKSLVALNPYSDDVWHFDTEFIYDHGAYRDIVNRLCVLARGDLKFDEVKDYVVVEDKVAWVELLSGQQVERIDLEVNDDWVDSRIVSVMQQRIAATGSQRRYACQGLGQDCLFVCQAPNALRKLNKTTGLRFTIEP